MEPLTIRQIAEAKVLRRHHWRIAREGQAGIGQKDDPSLAHSAEWLRPADPS